MEIVQVLLIRGEGRQGVILLRGDPGFLVMKGPIPVTVCPVPRVGPVGNRVGVILSTVPRGTDILPSPVFPPIRSVGWSSPGPRLGPAFLPLGMVDRAAMSVVLGGPV